MNTCGFCGSEVNNSYCSFCVMELNEQYISKDSKRLNKSDNFLGFPSSHNVYKTTPELMTLETIDLLCLLRIARNNRAEVYKLRLLRHKAEEQSGMTDEVKHIGEATYSEYEKATRKVWVIENIIKDRLGYFPEKITNNFLNIYIERMEKTDHKDMKMMQNTKQ